MPRLPKRDLLRRFELAIQDAGARLIFRAEPGDHPGSYSIVHRDGEASRLLAYIWNLTHGGGAARPIHEYRIQITGIAGFRNVPGEKTLILGWSEDFEVFAGFDYRFHADAFGASPSMQISRDALRGAQLRGFAPNVKDNGELAIAFRPDFAPIYVQHLDALHEAGALPAEAVILEQISQHAGTIADAEIEAAVAPARRRELMQTVRDLRDARFRRRVLSAYGNRCAMCGVQLRLLDAAHVLPVEQPGSTDETDNGVALCALHHRAYDRGLVAFGVDYGVMTNAAQVDDLVALSMAGGLKAFQAALKPNLLLPSEPRDYPKADFIVAANRARGWR